MGVDLNYWKEYLEHKGLKGRISEKDLKNFINEIEILKMKNEAVSEIHIPINIIRLEFTKALLSNSNWTMSVNNYKEEVVKTAFKIADIFIKQSENL